MTRRKLPDGVYLRPDGLYGWRLRHGGQHLNRGPYATAAAASQARTNVKAGEADETPHGDATTTVAELFGQWIESRLTIRANTRVYYGNFLHNHVEGTPFGKRPVGEITGTLEERAWLASRTTLGTGQRFILAGLLRCAGAMAVDEHWLTWNPFPTPRKLGLPAPQPKRVIVPSPAEVQQISDSGHPRIRAMILTQAMTGLRIGEMRGLRWQDIMNGPRGAYIHLMYQRTQLDQMTLAPLKNSIRTPVRDIPLTSACAAVLAAHKLQFGTGEDGTVFVNATRRPWGKSHLADLYREAFVAAGRPDLTPQALRHHYVSVLLRQGVQIHEVAERIGDDPEQVLHTYGHLMPGADATSPALAAAWDGVTPGETSYVLHPSGRAVTRPDTPAVRTQRTRQREYKAAQRAREREAGTA